METMLQVVREHADVAVHLAAILRNLPREEWNLDALRANFERFEANLDALRIAGEVAIATVSPLVDDDPHAAAVLAILLAEHETAPEEGAQKAVGLLRHESRAIRIAANWGLRLARCGAIEAALRACAEGVSTFAGAAALDILAFHRLPIEVDVDSVPDEIDADIALRTIEAAGRVAGAWQGRHLRRFLAHADGRIREAALRAAARSAVPELKDCCRAAVAASTPPEAIEFLGVVGDKEDLRRLLTAAEKAEKAGEMVAAKAAVRGLGRLGYPGAVPFLLGLLEHEGLGGTAAAAAERILGKKLPRGPLPKPPAGASADEVDVWEAEAPVGAKGAAEMWKGVGGRFEEGKRYQAGVCVSEDPLGGAFGELMLASREGVYLRERAGGRRVGDLESEGWVGHFA